MQTKTIDTALLELNEGQIQGIPSNPRSWTVKELNKLKKSIEETPELLAIRPPIVVRHGDKYVVLGGNMRVCAIKSLGYETADCIVLPENLDAHKLKEITIKDNANLGSWDYDALANEWGDYPLQDYGINILDIPEEDEPSNGDGNSSPVDDRVLIEIELSPDEFSFVNEKLRDLGDTPEEAVRNLLTR